MDKKHLNNKGLSLVEVVMSALLLSVVLAALFATYQNANNLLSLSRSKLIALTWAQSAIAKQKVGIATPIDPALPNWLSVEKDGTPAVTSVDLNNTMQSIKVTISWIE